jgi:6-phosphogluconolactonase (cycloisomerase 2 family)
MRYVQAAVHLRFRPPSRERRDGVEGDLNIREVSMIARPKTFIAVVSMVSLLAPAGPATPAFAQATRPRVLYVSNLGSDPGSATVAMFTVDRQTGSLSPLADPVPAGAGPRGVVATPDGRFVYVADTDGGQMLVYSVGKSGKLTALETVPTDGDPFGLAMAPDGRTLYAAAQGTDQVAVFPVGPDGRLGQQVSVASGGKNPRGVAVSPDGRFVYVTNGLRDPAVPGTLAVFAVTGDGHLPLKLLTSIEIGRFGASITISPDGRFLYAESQATNQIRGYRRSADGLLAELPGSPFASPNDPEGIAITPDARHIYTAATGQMPNGTPGGPGNVQGFNAQPSGSLGPARLFEAGQLPNALALSPSARFLYAGNGDSSDITAYAIGPDGTLRQIPGSPFKGLDSPAFQAMAMLPNQGPTARFSAKPGTPARFDATASADPDGRVARYDWEFGDGTVLANGGPTPTHTYTRPGTFTVTLTVTDDEGCSDHQVFTGQSTLCTGSPAARTSQTIKN